MPVRPDRMRRTAAGRVCALDLAPGVGLAVSLRRHEPGMQVRLGVCVRPCSRRRGGRRFQAARRRHAGALGCVG